MLAYAEQILGFTFFPFPRDQEVKHRVRLYFEWNRMRNVCKNISEAARHGAKAFRYALISQWCAKNY